MSGSGSGKTSFTFLALPEQEGVQPQAEGRWAPGSPVLVTLTACIAHTGSLRPLMGSNKQACAACLTHAHERKVHEARLSHGFWPAPH